MHNNSNTIAVNELRIGNIVKDTSYDKQGYSRRKGLKAIDQFSIDLLLKAGIANPFIGIQISFEWLKNCDFCLIIVNGTDMFLVEDDVEISIYDSGTILEFIPPGANEDRQQYQVNYIHELQNIYYNLKQKELISDPEELIKTMVIVELSKK